MPIKGNGKRSRAQGKNAPRLEKETAAQYRDRQREYAKQQREYNKARNKAERERERELRSVLKRASETGIYNPKSPELTPYRKRRLEKIRREQAELLDTNKNFFIPVSKQQRKAIADRATALDMSVTRKGIFVKKEGHKNASLKYDAKHKEYYVERRGKTKKGVNRGRKYKDHIPFASLDELDKERDRLRRAAKRIKLKGDEVLAFKITEFGLEGYSRQTFGDIEALLRHLDKYEKTAASKVNFFRHIIVEKSESTDQWYEEHPTKEYGASARRQRGIAKGTLNTRSSKG